MGDRVLVRFEGEGSGVEELSWGQRELWAAMEHKHTWLPIGAVQPLPPGTTVADAIADLRFVMDSYPSMRTRLRFDPDGPKQVVAGSGDIPLEIVDADEGADPAEVAGQVEERYRQADFDFVTDWPVRMAVVKHRGVLTHRVWIMCHLVTDGGGANVVLAELADRDATGSRGAMAPLEQARWQRSPAGQRQCQAALRHWEQVLRGIPAGQFPERTEQTRPRYWQAGFDSPATYLAVRVISARTGVEAASVLLALFAVAMVRAVGVNPVVVQVVVNNRFRPRLARTVSPLIQGGACLIEVGDTTVDAAVKRVRRLAIAAYKSASYDPARRDELLARVQRERGEPVDIECGFNDRRLTPWDETGPVPTAEQVRAALPDGSFRWVEKQDHRPFDKLYLNVDDVPDTVAITVTTDTRYLAPDAVEALVRVMQELAVAAALDPDTRTRVAVPGRGVAAGPAATARPGGLYVSS